MRLIEKMKENNQKLYEEDIVSKQHKIIKDISYINDGTDDHKLDIIYPDEEQIKYPFILNIHGGCFCIGSKEFLTNNHGMRLAENRFAVVNINFRSSIDHKFPAQIYDVLEVINFLQNKAYKYKLDMDNMFIVGTSSGAYIAMLTTCIFNNIKMRRYFEVNCDVEIRGVASYCGLFDFHTVMGKDSVFPMKEKFISMLFGTSDFEKLVSYTYSSVLNNINEDFPPVYLMDTEYKSFINETYRLEKVLKENKVPYKIRVFDAKDELEYAFNTQSKYKQSGVVIDETFEFFGKEIR